LGSAEVSANWVYSVYENTSSYSSSVYETDSEKYQVNFSLYPGTSFISVKLVYNGTEYVVSDITNYGNLVELKKTIDIPLNSQVYTTENKSFFWNFIFSNSFGTINQNSSVKTQSVVPVNVVKCNNTFPTDTVNITIYDELYPTTKLNSSFFATWTFWKGTGTVKKNYSFLNDSNLNYQYKFCINPNQTSVYANLISEITSTGYWDRTHYLYNYTLNNATKEITVLMLNDTIGVKFFHTLRQAVTRISDAIVTISKYDVGTGLWVVVGIRQSDVDGEFVEYLELDKQYSYLVTKNGVALGTILKTSTCSATPCLMDLALGETSVDLWGGYYDSWGENIIYTLNYSKDTHNVTLKFEDTSGLASYFRLIVSKVSGNDSGGILCNRTLYSTVGTIVCGTAGYQGQFVAKAYSSSSPEKPFAFLYGIVQALAEILGKDEGLFFAFLIIVIVGLIGAWNPAVGVLLAGVAFIFAAIMGLIIMSMTSIILIILLIIILVVKMGRNSV
jgi:hypothetical protein